MPYTARILAHSVPTGGGSQLFTLEVTFPRFILAELNTHRVLSRNSASSRAIPPERAIAQVQDDPFVPEVFRRRVRGMGQGEVLPDQEAAREAWLQAAADAVQHAKRLAAMDVAKSLVNRVLEPFRWHTALLTATEWDNFFGLRCPPGDEVDPEFPAQPEFQRIAIEMRRVMRESQPQPIRPDRWHLPLVSADEVGAHRDDPEWLCMLSAGRCATISYERGPEIMDEDPEASVARAERLLQQGHMSPFEHQARPANTRDVRRGLHRRSNLRGGWVSFRVEIPREANPTGYKWRQAA